MNLRGIVHPTRWHPRGEDDLATPFKKRYAGKGTKYTVGLVLSSTCSGIKPHWLEATRVLLSIACRIDVPCHMYMTPH